METKKPTLEISLDSMAKIKDRLGQWMILEEHWTQNNLSRYQQLDLARGLFKEISAEIDEAHRTCPHYSQV